MKNIVVGLIFGLILGGIVVFQIQAKSTPVNKEYDELNEKLDKIMEALDIK